MTDELNTLRAEVERLSQAYFNEGVVAASLRERIAELEEALRPFAECMNYLQLTQETFNNARAALNAEGKK